MNFPIRRFLTLIAVLFAAGALNDAFAQDKVSHQKVIDFEDEVVEGMNKRPLDSLSQISERDRRRKKAHLYRKRVGFRSETAETLNTLRFVQ